jgi:FtsH-binding integral membrane protein
MDASVKEIYAQKENMMNNKERSKIEQTIRQDFLLTLIGSGVCLIFFLIYDQFSHNVRSAYMTYLFLWPLILGALPYGIMTFITRRTSSVKLPGNESRLFYNLGLEAVTMSSLLRGIFEIAGTASIYQTFLMYGGIVLLIIGIMFYAFIPSRKKAA